MTRINCVPVSTLTNTHAMAEYKEITRPLNKILARLGKGALGTLPGVYCLGKGHETFFFDKAEYLLNRRQELFKELSQRGYELSRLKFEELQIKFTRELRNTAAWNDWQPTPEDMYLNMSRLVERHYGKKFN